MNINNCSKCIYRRDIREDGDSQKQICSRWMNTSGDLCKTETTDYGDSPGDNNGEPISCELNVCPSYCRFPYQTDLYNDIPEDVDPQDFYSNINNVKDEYKNINGSLKTYVNVPSGLENVYSCGDLVVPQEGDDEIDIPNLPNVGEYGQALEVQSSLNNIGTDWSKVKLSEQLTELYGSSIIPDQNVLVLNDVNGNLVSIPIANNGILLEDWNPNIVYTEGNLRSMIPDDIGYVDLETIHNETGGILQNVFGTHTMANMIPKEIEDWLMKRNYSINFLNPIVPNVVVQEEGSPGEITCSILNIPCNSPSNMEFATCMNTMMITDDDDNIHVENISNLEHISDLGKPENKKELDYVEKKIIKFLVLKKEEVIHCMDIVYITDNICSDGFSGNYMRLLSHLFDINSNDENVGQMTPLEKSEYTQKMNVISKRLYKYIPNIIYKLIEISEYYEKHKCNDTIHNNTVMLKGIYNSIINNTYNTYSLPSLGIGEFFKSFQDNMITRIILLIFIAFMFSKISGLFKVQYTINK
jgi:hypothetical protein